MLAFGPAYAQPSRYRLLQSVEELVVDQGALEMALGAGKGALFMELRHEAHRHFTVRAGRAILSLRS